MTLEELKEKHPNHAENIVTEPRPDCAVCHGTGEYASNLVPDFVDACYCTYGPSENDYQWFVANVGLIDEAVIGLADLILWAAGVK